MITACARHASGSGIGAVMTAGMIARSEADDILQTLRGTSLVAESAWLCGVVFH